VLVLEKMRQAWTAALAVSILWASTLTFPIMGLGYCLTRVALDRIEHWRRGRDPLTTIACRARGLAPATVLASAGRCGRYTAGRGGARAHSGEIRRRYGSAGSATAARRAN